VVAEVPLLVVPVLFVVVLELVVLSAVAAVPAAPDPESPPQPASAIDTLPSSAGQTIRPDPNARWAFLMRPPNGGFNCRSSRTKSPIRELHERTAKP
jgi:hypothetical protein